MGERKGQREAEKGGNYIFRCPGRPVGSCVLHLTVKQQSGPSLSSPLVVS